MKDDTSQMSQGHHEGGNHPSVDRAQHEVAMNSGANPPPHGRAPAPMAQAAMGAQDEMVRMMQG